MVRIRAGLADTDRTTGRRRGPLCPAREQATIWTATLEGMMPAPTTPTHVRNARPPLDEPHLLAWEQDARAESLRSVTADLSRSELDVLEDAANGLTTRQSAIERSKSPETVKSQRTSVLAKLGARNMVQAVAITVRERQVTAGRVRPIRFL
jgi:DNA-binding CsgD family transcriptional regulator